MPNIRVITDSTADLSADLVEREHLTVVPLVVLFDEQSYRDGIELDGDGLFRLVEANHRLPKTSSPSPADFKAAFEQATADGSQALYIGLSSQFSATVQNARIAATMLPEGRVRVIDSANLSTGIGLLVLQACDLVRQGLSMDELVTTLEASRPKVRSCFMVDGLDYIRMGGRCSSATALAGTLLRLRPVIAVVDGGMVVTAKIRGARKKGLDWMLERFADDARKGLVRPERIFITHSGAEEDARYMEAEVRRILPDVGEILETRAGCVISSHCGPATIGILYMLK